VSESGRYLSLEARDSIAVGMLSQDTSQRFTDFTFIGDDAELGHARLATVISDVGVRDSAPSDVMNPNSPTRGFSNEFIYEHIARLPPPAEGSGSTEDGTMSAAPQPGSTA
jgi:hypothetical protein